jgi:hypothetical protein
MPALATAVAEGSWLFVVYAAFRLSPPGAGLILGLWAFIVTAAVGIAMSRLVRGKWSLAARTALFVLAAVLGWAIDPSARDLALAGSLSAAIQIHGSGYILGAAAWRGTRHGDPKSDDLVVGALLARAVPGLAIPWLFGMAGAGRMTFIENAFPATLLFVAAGLVATGVTRLDALGRTVGLDWRRNRMWIVLLVGVVVLVIALGLPFAVLLGVSIRAIVAVLAAPIAAVGGFVGAVLGPIAIAIGGLVPASGGTQPGAPSPGSGLPEVPGALGDALALALGLVFLVGLIGLWRRVRRMPRGQRREPAPEERHVVLPSIDLGLSLPHVPRFAFRRHRPPATATAAYVALLRDLGSDDRRARRPTEAPDRHARRLREQGDGDLALDLLAADFELERYGDRLLTAREVRRSIGRWRRARRSNRLPDRARR